ncbi:MAG TPA: aldolase/citrate lyase family protein [Acidimicrobiales bacterium]|nr:aldolase/citrate lyase family protein [Acidimicrobiales bacterium]
MERAYVRPLRTVLFCAGDQPDDIRRGLASGADSIVIDLEEPRTPFPESARVDARRDVQFLLSNPAKVGEPLIFVRIQSPGTGQTLKDLRAVMGTRLTGVLVPKVQGPHDIHAIDALLSCTEVDLDLPMGRTMVYPILETAPALRLAYEIAMASSRVAYMGGAVSRFGDIHQAVGYRWTAEGRETLFLRSKILIDARAAGIRYPISGMWGGDRDDEEGLRGWCTDLRNLGYYGMMIADPFHIPIVHEHFSPTPEDIAYWQELDALAKDAERTGQRAVQGDANQGEGHIVHIAHVGSARQNLEWARGLGLVP